MAELCSNFGDSATSKSQIAYFYCSCAQRPYFYFRSKIWRYRIFLLPVKHLTSPSCSPTPISYKMQEFWRFGHKQEPNCIFFNAHARNAYISTSGQKSEVTIRPLVRAKLHIFHCACAKRPYLYFRSNIWRHYRVRRPRFFMRCRNFGDSAINMGQIAHFLLRMSETAIFLLPVKNARNPDPDLL